MKGKTREELVKQKPFYALLHHTYMPTHNYTYAFKYAAQVLALKYSAEKEENNENNVLYT